MGMEKSPAIRGGHWGGSPPERTAQRPAFHVKHANLPVLASAARTTSQFEAFTLTYHWYRTLQTGTGTGYGYAWMCAIPSGSTYRRVRFSWGFAGTTPTTTALNPMFYGEVVMGLCTTIGNGSEVPPNPYTSSGDAAPPTQRWIWWEARQPVITAVSQDAGIIAWRDGGNQEIVDTKAQVLATGIPSGDTLNLFASWGGPETWDVFGQVVVWVATSVLYSTP